MAIVEGRGLVKEYNGLTAVDNVDFTIERKECFGFLGPNGAGKSTIMKMIYCRSPITRGDIQVNGFSVKLDPRKIKAMIGVATQDDNLDRDLTVWENLYVYASYFDLQRSTSIRQIAKLLSFFDLTDKADMPVDELSGGMRRKLIVARALINNPDLLILDEPTTGLDPQARRQIWDTVIDLKSKGKTIILTTHYMDEAQELCDRIAVMLGGRILESGSPSDLIERVVGTSVCEMYTPSKEEASSIRDKVGGSVEQFGSRLYIYGNDAEVLREKCEAATGQRHNVRETSLEDVFLRLTRRRLK
ncbi:MAG TPA: ABC transporter ATP-binding protein [Methanocella sp.]|nr:ABC transporter ATP-binding protein [Methanocella sp.]